MSGETGTGSAIIEALSGDRYLPSAIHYFATHSLEISERSIGRILKTAGRLNQRLSSVHMEMVVQSSRQIEELALFGMTVLGAIEVVDDQERLGTLVECLDRIVTAVGTIAKVPNISIFFAKMFKFYAVRADTREIATHLVETLIGLKHVQINLMTPSFFRFLIEELFTKEELAISCEWFVQCFTGKAADLKLDSSMIPDICIEAMRQDRVSESNAMQLTRYICRLMAIVTASDPEAFKYFVDNNGLRTFLEFLLKFGVSENTFVSLALIQKNCVEADVVCFMINQIREPIDARVVDIFMEDIVVLLSKDAMKLHFQTEETNTPYEQIFQGKARDFEVVRRYVDVFKKLAELRYSKLGDCASLVWQAVLEGRWFDEGLIEGFFGAIQVFLSDPATKSSDFLMTCSEGLMLLPEASMLVSLLHKCPSYLATLIAVYSEGIKEEEKGGFLKQFISIKALMPEDQFCLMIGKFLSGGPSVVATRFLFDCQEIPVYSIFSIFLASFVNEEACAVFLDNEGLNWVDSQVASDNLPVTSLPDVIIAVSKNRVFGQVSSWIASLDISTHVLFTLPLEVLWEMAFGQGACPVLLRVPALLPLLTDVRVALSPVSAFYGGKYGLSEFLRHGLELDRIEYLSAFTNQYLRPEHYHLLETRGSSWAQHVSLKHDHFSVFEMAPNSKESAFTIDVKECRRICFWIRIEDSRDDFRNRILESDSFSLEAKRAELVLSTGSETGSVDVKTSDWVFLGLDILAVDGKTRLVLTANESILELPFPLENFERVTFGSFEQCCERRWFIGPVIRFCKLVQDRVLEKLRDQGPDNCVVNFKEEKIVLPTSNIKVKGKTAFAVPYAGFFSYVRRRQCLNSWFCRLIDCTDFAQFADIFQMLLNCYIVSGGTLVHFVCYLANALKKKRQFVSNELFSSMVSALVKVAKLKQIEYLLRDLDLWEMYCGNICAEVTRNHIEVPADICAYSFVHNFHQENLRDVFVDIILECSVRPINIAHMMAIAMGNPEMSGVVIHGLIQNWDRIREYASHAISFSTLLAVMGCETNMETLVECIDLMVLMSAANSKFLQDAPLLLDCFSKVLKGGRIWFQLFSLLTGTSVFTGASICQIFGSMEVIHPDLIPLAVGMVIHALIFAGSAGDSSDLPIAFESLSIIVSYLGALDPKTKARIGELVYFRWPLVYHPECVNGCAFDKRAPTLDVVQDVARLLKEIWKVSIDCVSTAEKPAEETSPLVLVIPTLEGVTEISSGEDLLANLDENHLSTLVDFLTCVLLWHVDVGDDFAFLLGRLVFQKPFQFMVSLSGLTARLVAELMSKDEVIRRLDAITVLLAFTASTMASVRGFGKACGPVYQLLFPTLNRIVKEHGAVLGISRYLQVILIKMFAFLDPSQVETVVEMMLTSHNDLCIELGVFSPQFVNALKKRLTRVFQDKFAEVEVKATHPDPANPPNPKVSDYRRDLSNLLGQALQRNQEYCMCRAVIPQFYADILKFQLDLFLRSAERDSCVIMVLDWLSHTRNTEKQAYTLCERSWPFLPSRVLVQTPFPVVHMAIDDQEQNSRDIPVAEAVKCSPFEFHRLYPVQHTNVAARSVDPIQYSVTCTLDPKILLNQFLVLHRIDSDLEDIVNGFFIRYTEKKHCVVFVTKTHMILLLLASVRNSGLYFEDTVQSPLLYQMFLDSLRLGFYGIFSLFCGHVVLVIPFSSIIHARKHYWLHKPVGLCLWSRNTPEFILVPEVDTFPRTLLDKVFQARGNDELINVPVLSDLTPEKAAEMWTNRSISTWDFLLIINGLSGRSFADISQYPVVPWISGFDENGQCIKRDLSKPMGQQTPGRTDEYDALYATSGTHFYGSHYSMPSIVHYFLVRIPPFLQISIDLHQGFDDKCRMFTSVSNTWISASKRNSNDVKELIPEWYCLPEMFVNVNGLTVEDLDGKKFDVTIGTSQPHTFVIGSRAQLEREETINRWVDLIFGVAQRGHAAVVAKNLFPLTSYHIQPSDDTDLATLELQLEHWGQCPAQLFTKPLGERTRVKKPPLFVDLMAVGASVPISPLVLFIPTADSYGHLSVIPSSSSVLIKKSSQAKSGLKFFDPCFAFATNISVSSKKNFLAVDLETGLTLVYRLKYVKNQPRELKPFGQYSHNFAPTTRINEVDCICASFNDKDVTLWDFRRMTVNRAMRLGRTVLDVAFDEYLGLFLILTDTWLRVFTVNGLKVTGIQCMKAATAICVPYVPSTEMLRPIFLGFSDGSIAMLALDTSKCEIVSLWSQALGLRSIVQIMPYTTPSSLICKDRSGKTVVVSSSASRCDNC